MMFETVLLENSDIQLIDGDRGKNYPKQADFSEDGFCLFLSAKNVTSSGFEFSERSYISSEKDELLRAGKLKRGDIVVTTRGTIGNVAYYGDDVPFDHIRINSGMMIFRADENRWNKRFLYFLLTSSFIRQQIDSLTSGSAVPQLPARDLKKFSLPNIPKNIQDRIERVVGDLTDKIKFNRQTNQTLEQIAQAIFKSWFVDFDPVKAKMNGEQPNGMDTGTASLFSEKLVESELGLIPEGWPVGKLSELIKFANGKSGTKSDSGQFPLYGANGIIGFSEEAMFEDAVIIGRVGAYCGAIEYCNSQFWASDNTIVATAKGGKAQLPFVLYLLKFLDLNQHAGGAAQPLLNQKVLNSLEVPIPSNAVLEKYGELLATMLDKMTHNIEENHNLESLRETLLPKLLSGEIDLTSEVTA
ncbi:restriction endonuclease subunit S [Vibrio vulnificus]|uniref:restriction endonuclease subunit S n=1 Tax=Vibrio vulnificus TaxID=672 RepID=UPI000CD2A544|nr:restriction endonuclease subunit S [Vibrio vulnificus]POC05477.1 hypothetical protein CRN39_17210 [Vibrio vulnificus]